MIIPPGLTVNIGLREYHEGDKLPDNAPDAVKKQVSDSIAELAKKGKELAKPDLGVTPGGDVVNADLPKGNGDK